jgi:DNA-binding MarR family transcriptional regulator
LGPSHSFWNVLGPAQAPRYGSGPHGLRGGIDPASATTREPEGEGEGAARVARLVVILAEANRVATRCMRDFSRVRDSSGLSGIEALTLMAIAHAAKPPTVPQVGRSLGHPRQVIQRAVRVLEQAGLVESRPNPAHKRAALLVVTDGGRKLARGIDAEAAQVIAGLAEGLDLDLPALAALGDGLLALRQRMDDMTMTGE